MGCKLSSSQTPKPFKDVTGFFGVQSTIKIWIISRCSSVLQRPSTNRSEAFLHLAINRHGNQTVEHTSAPSISTQQSRHCNVELVILDLNTTYQATCLQQESILL